MHHLAQGQPYRMVSAGVSNELLIGRAQMDGLPCAVCATTTSTPLDCIQPLPRSLRPAAIRSPHTALADTCHASHGGTLTRLGQPPPPCLGCLARPHSLLPALHLLLSSLLPITPPAHPCIIYSRLLTLVTRLLPHTSNTASPSTEQHGQHIQTFTASCGRSHRRRDRRHCSVNNRVLLRRGHDDIVNRHKDLIAASSHLYCPCRSPA